MKNKVMLFEEFVGSLNEGKDWYDFKPENIAKAFMKDGEPGEGPNITTDQLDQWIGDFAYFKKIEDGLPYDVAEEIVDFLKKKGYKNLDVDDLRTDGAFESTIYESVSKKDNLKDFLNEPSTYYNYEAKHINWDVLDKQFKKLNVPQLIELFQNLLELSKDVSDENADQYAKVYGHVYRNIFMYTVIKSLSPGTKLKLDTDTKQMMFGKFDHPKFSKRVGKIYTTEIVVDKNRGKVTEITIPRGGAEQTIKSGPMKYDDINYFKDVTGSVDTYDVFFHFFRNSKQGQKLLTGLPTHFEIQK